MKRIEFFGAIAALSVSAVTSAPAATLIENGSFDSPDISTAFVTYNSAPAGFGWSILSDGTPFPSATTGFNGVDVVGEGGTGGTSNADGLDQFVDIDGLSVLWQDFATVAGRRYSLSFAYSHNPVATAESIRVLVAGGGTLLDRTVTHNLANSLADPEWRTFATTFTAAAALTTLSFNGLDGGSAFDRAQGFFLDNVAVTVAPVPLPAAATLLLGALGALVVLRRRLPAA
jgi:hypothetical protein